MIGMLIAAGAIPEQAASSTAPFDVPRERIAVAARVQGSSQVATGIPQGAAIWEQPFEPADQVAFGFSFDELLDDGETIAGIERIALSSAAAALGVLIDVSAGRAPSIDEDGERRVQLWFAVADGFQAASSYDAAGVRFPVSFRIATSKGKRFERSAVLTVRQL